MTAGFIYRVPPRALTSQKFRGIQRKHPGWKTETFIASLPCLQIQASSRAQLQLAGAVWASSTGACKQSGLLAVHSSSSVPCSALQLRVCWLGSLDSSWACILAVAWDKCNSLVSNTPSISYAQEHGKQDLRGRKIQTMPRERIQHLVKL